MKLNFDEVFQMNIKLIVTSPLTTAIILYIRYSLLEMVSMKLCIPHYQNCFHLYFIFVLKLLSMHI